MKEKHCERITNTLGPHQVSWCLSVGLSNCNKALAASMQATAFAEEYTDELGLTGNPREQMQNAIRHATWMALLLVRGFTSEEAMSFGAAHELDVLDPDLGVGSFEANVDFHNNLVGVTYGKLITSGPEFDRKHEDYNTSVVKWIVTHSYGPECTGLCLDLRGT
ncbi:DUF6973 domain-containing protein [Nonomuraea rubra]|uniref:DUF6973 domain-containing protein n=1 Tax=Nonomuraea rubra TaxID=46180 RepID=UPI0033DFC42D